LNLSDRIEDAAATSGFVGGLISSLMKTEGTGCGSAHPDTFPLH